MAESTGLQAWVAHVQKLKEKNEKGQTGFAREYAIIRRKSVEYFKTGQFTTHVAKLPCNIKKNRYKDIVPFDHCRVRLPAIPNVPGSDFINASVLTEAEGRPTIIAAQGPLPHTVLDFWRMLWCYEIKVVVMAAKCVEGGKQKVERYWPETGQTLLFDEIRVTNVRMDKSNAPDFVVTHLKAELGGITRDIFHFQYLTWPDHGVPESPSAVMKMMVQVRQKHDWSDQWPIVLHCSAGCGRTGTLAAIDQIWLLLKNELLDAEINLFQLVSEFRRHRQSMVQTMDQYLYVYRAVLDLVKNVLAGVSEIMPGALQVPSGKKDGVYVNMNALRDKMRLLSHPRIRALTMLTGEVNMEDIKAEAKSKGGQDEDAVTGLEGEQPSLAASSAPLYVPKYCLDDFGDVSHPARLEKPKGPRTPKSFILPHQFVYR